MFKKLFLKPIAAVLIFTFSYSQLLYAADVRQMLLDAKHSFEEEDERRVGGLNPEAFGEAQLQQQQVVDNQQALEDLQSTNFSLTTQNGGILTYVGNKLKEVKRPDGTQLKNIALDQNGNIIDADLRLNDGSVQIFQGGKVLGYQLPDGTQVIYENNEITKTISPDGTETVYSTIKDSQGSITQTILENVKTKSFYDQNNKVSKTISKEDNTTTEYVDGLIEKIIAQDNSQILFKQIPYGNDIKIVFDQYKDPEGVASFELPEGKEPPFQYLLYRQDFTLKEALTIEGNKLLFNEEGLLTRILDEQNNQIDLSFEQSSLSNVLGSQIVQNGIISKYDEKGNLSQVTLNGLTIHYKKDSNEIDFIVKDDGTQLRGLTFNAEGQILNALVITPDGEERVYENQKLVSIKETNQDQLFYFDDKIIKLITSQGITYNFSYTPEKIEAAIDPSFIVGDALTPVKMEYDQNFSLKKLIRQNNQILDYLNDDLVKITFSSGDPQVFNYTKDPQGNILSYTVAQGGTESFYDADNSLLKVIIHETLENPHTLEVLYKYDKIREIYKDDVLTFKYSYSFDTAPDEITTIEDLEEKALKVYKDELLLTSFNTDTNVLSTYSYDLEKRVSKVEVTRFGKSLHVYTYIYEGQNTIVTDEEGAKRVYDQDKKLSFLEKDSVKYAYTYHQGVSGEEITRETLLEQKLSDGSVVRYENGRPVRIDNRPDGSVISDILLNTDGALSQATITFQDGTKKVFNQTQILEEILPDKTHLYFANNALARSVDPQGKESLYSYEKDAQGNIQAIWLKVNNTDLKYSPSGDLLGLKLPGIMVPDDVLKAATHTYQGGSNGSFSYDANFNTAQVGGRTTLVSEHTFPSAQAVEEFTYKFTANSYSSGSTDNGSDARTYIETKDATTGQWTTVPGTYLGQSHSNGGGGGSTAYADAAQTTKKVTVSNVIAVRAVAYAGAFSNGGGSTGGTTAIWEIQLKLNDQSFLTFSKTAQNLKFQGQKGTITYDLQGNLLTGYSQSLNTQATALKNIIDDITLLPYKDKVGLALPQDHASWVDILKNEALSPSVFVAQDYSADGVLETQKKADQTTVVLENNKPVKTLDKDGNVLMEYFYDAEGNLSRVNLKNARDTLPDEVLRAKLKIEEQRAVSLKNLAVQKKLAYQSIEAESITQRSLLNVRLGDLQNQYDATASSEAYGSAGQSQKAYDLSQISGVINTILDALITIFTNEANRYKALDQEVTTLSNQIETDSQKAFTELAAQEINLKKEILRQETSPVVYDYYRRILGRDPSSQEYDTWISKVDYDNPGFVFVDEMSQIQKGGSLAMDGNDDEAEILDSPDWDYGTGDFTFDFWFKPNVFTSAKTYNLFQGDGGNFRLFRAYDNKLKVRIEGTTKIFDVWTPLVGSWYHIALVRQGGNVSLFINGTKLGITQSATANVQWGGRLSIADNTNCFIEEFRISKGIARWTQNFTPSAQRVAVDSYTKLLLRSDFSNGAVFRDFSSSNHAIDLDDGAHVDDTQYKTLGTFEVVIPTPKELTLALKNHLESLPELLERQTYVQAIKDRVTLKINQYLSMNDAERVSFAQSLGLVQNDLIPLSEADTQKILTWINSRGLHFGQSAFLSLESLLDQKGIPYAREDLAEKCILIDILTGIISPLDDGDLVISMFALNKVAQGYGLALSGANLSFEDLLSIYQSSPTAKIIAHVNGNHYVVIQSITADSITYMDPGRGKDKQNEVMTLSKKDFLKSWTGNVTAETSIVSTVIPAEAGINSARLLTQDETQKIRGAFFFLLIPAIIGAISSIAGAVGAIMAGIGAILSTIGSLVGSILSGVGQILGGVLQGIGYIGNAIFQGIHFAASSLFHAFGNVGSFLSQGIFGSAAKAGFGSTIFQTAVKIGVNFAVQKGLESIGVNPVISNLISAFVTGGIQGFTSPISAVQTAAGVTRASMIASSIFQAVSVEGIGQLGIHLGIDSGLTNILSLATSAIGGNIIQNPGTTLERAFSNIKPQLFSSLALYGMDKLSSSIGLPSIVGKTIGASVLNTLDVVFQGGVDVGQSIIQSLQEGFLNTAISYGVHFARDSISDPLLGSLASRALAGAIEGALFKQNIFSGLFDAAKQSVFDLFGRNKYELLSNITEFTTLISQKGSLAAAFEAYATDIFDRGTVESVLRSGGFTSALLSPKQDITLPTGEIAKKATLSQGTSVLFNEQGQFIGLERGGVTQLGKFGITNQGTFGLIEGQIFGQTQTGDPYSGTVKDGQAITLTIDVGGNEIKIGGTNNSSVVFDQAGQLIDGYIDVGRGAYNFVVNAGNLQDYFVSTAQAADFTIVMPGGQVYHPTQLDIKPDQLAGTGTDTQTGPTPPKYLVRFMTQDEFLTASIENTLRTNTRGELYTTDSLSLFDTAKEAADSLQLGNGLPYVGHTDENRAGYFVVFDSRNLNPTVPEAEQIKREYATYDGKIPDPNFVEYTGRVQRVFRGFAANTALINLLEPVQNNIRKIHMSINNIFERFAALFQITQRAKSA